MSKRKLSRPMIGEAPPVEGFNEKGRYVEQVIADICRGCGQSKEEHPWGALFLRNIKGEAISFPLCVDCIKALGRQIFEDFFDL